MAAEEPDEHFEIEKRIVGLYNILYEDQLTRDDIEFYVLEDERFEGEVYLPYIGLNVELWEEWSTEKRVEVLLHEFAHTDDYDDDHHPSFWDRVVELTDIAIAHSCEIEGLFGEPLNPDELKETVVESIHEYVIEGDVDSVEVRKREVSRDLGLSLNSDLTD